jgi:hypothetical protein
MKTPDATPAWPRDADGKLVIDERLALLAGLCNHLLQHRAVFLALAEHIAEVGRDWPRCCTELFPTVRVEL